MAKAKEIPRERFLLAAKPALAHEGYEVLRTSLNPSRIEMQKDGRRLVATLLTLGPGRQRFTLDPDEEGHLRRLDGVDLVLFSSTVGDSHWRLWVAAVPVDNVRTAYAAKWMDRVRTNPQAVKSAPLAVFFDPVPPNTPAHRAVGAGFGQYALWRVEVGIRAGLDGPDQAYIREPSGQLDPVSGGAADPIAAAFRQLRRAIAEGLPGFEVELEAVIKLNPRATSHDAVSGR